jgi:hypothetical protein
VTDLTVQQPGRGGSRCDITTGGDAEGHEMNAPRMDQETVERLLVGPVTDAQDGPEVLVRLLASVRAAPHPHELSGEAAALRAFRLARAGLAPVPAARPQRRFRTGRLGIRVALTALIAATTGGVALAATGTLPGPLGRQPVAAPSAGAGGHTSPTSGPGTSATPGPDRTDPPGGTAAVRGLCTAYRAHPGENRGKALENPRFADLIVAAGGQENVPGYCDRLLDGPDKTKKPAADPTKRPNAGPSGRPTGRPEHPPAAPAVTGTPTARPGGSAR